MLLRREQGVPRNKCAVISYFFRRLVSVTSCKAAPTAVSEASVVRESVEFSVR